MYCPNCNNFVDDNRENCPYCNTQIHSIVHVGTNERRVLEKIVGSKLFLVMAISLTLYLVFLAMEITMAINVLSLVLLLFGIMLVWRMWTLRIATVNKDPESPLAGRLTGFFTVQKVISIITAVLLAVVSLVMFSVLPYTQPIVDNIDELSMISSPITVGHVVYAFCEDAALADEVYAEIEAQGMLEYMQEYITFMEEAFSELTMQNEFVGEFIITYGWGRLFQIVMYVIAIFSAIALIFNILLAVYMNSATKFITDFCQTWDGFAPWRRGVRYGAWLGYLTSFALFVYTVFNLTSIPFDLSFLTSLCACVATFCFAKFTVKICSIMEELYKLDI